MTRYVIVRGDGLSDAIAGRMFASYDEASLVTIWHGSDALLR